MKYEIRYFREPPTDREVLDMMLAVAGETGNECESIDMIRDFRVEPHTIIMQEIIPPEPWKDTE